MNKNKLDDKVDYSIKTAFTLEGIFPDSFRIRNILESDSFFRLHADGRIRNKTACRFGRVSGRF